MQTSNRSRIKCEQHPNQQITNYCCDMNCLRPLCPDCVEKHTKSHSKQQIQSWKNCVNKCSRNVRQTLLCLKQIYRRLGVTVQNRSVQAIQAEALKKLYKAKQEIMDMVEEIFAYHEKQIKTTVRRQFYYPPDDHSKLKLAIEQLQKLSLKLSTHNTVLVAIKKSYQLDHEALVNYFEKQYKSVPTKRRREQFTFNIEQDSLNKIRKYLEHIVTYEQKERFGNVRQFTQQGVISPRETRQAFGVKPNRPLLINAQNYFKETSSKFLHFFVPFTNELKLLHISNATQNIKWKTVKLNIKNTIPTFHKSIITPNGQIYMTGGSQDPKKLDSIYRFNEQKNTLQLITNMINPRSSHSICYLNTNIYLLGGFKMDNEVYRQCEIFNLETRKCKSIAPLQHPSANGSACSFGSDYIFKFGGVYNKVSASNHIEMYSVSGNLWIVVDPQLQIFTDQFWLLSFSACVQINENQIFVFGGYNDSQDQASSNLSYSLYIQEKSLNEKRYLIKNINAYPLPEAEGFWDNCPIIHQCKVFSTQNIPDTDGVSSLVDQRRIVMFNGHRWMSWQN